MDISLIIPTLNEEKYLANLLNSLQKQNTSLDYEIIVADGDSEDRTRDIARQFTDKVVVENIRNAAAERQKGSQLAQGDILLFIDADCQADKNLIVEIYNSFNDSKVAIVSGQLAPLSGNMILKFACRFWGPLVRLSILFNKPLISGQCLAIRREVFEKIGGFSTQAVTAEDTLLAIQALKHGKYRYNPKVKIYFSTRRIDKMGLAKYLFFHFKNYFKTHWGAKPAADYKPIR